MRASMHGAISPGDILYRPDNRTRFDIWNGHRFEWNTRYFNDWLGHSYEWPLIRCPRSGHWDFSKLDSLLYSTIQVVIKSLFRYLKNVKPIKKLKFRQNMRFLAVFCLSFLQTRSDSVATTLVWTLESYWIVRKTNHTPSGSRHRLKTWKSWIWR